MLSVCPHEYDRRLLEHLQARRGRHVRQGQRQVHAVVRSEFEFDEQQERSEQAETVDRHGGGGSGHFRRPASACREEGLRSCCWMKRRVVSCVGGGRGGGGRARARARAHAEAGRSTKRMLWVLKLVPCSLVCELQYLACRYGCCLFNYGCFCLLCVCLLLCLFVVCFAVCCCVCVCLVVVRERETCTMAFLTIFKKKKKKGMW